MEILEEQSKPFSTQIQDVTKGINRQYFFIIERIRYLKQKINNTYCLLKGINFIEDDDDKQGQSTITNNDNSKQKRIQPQRSKRRQLKSVQSQRCFNLTKRLNLHQNFSKSKQKQLEFQPINKKWNNNFLTITQQKSSRPITRQMKKSDLKINNFYHNVIMTQNLSPSNQVQNLTLKQLKKVNYNQMKKEKQQLKIKLQQQKENRFKQILKKKQQVQLSQKLGQKRIFLFMKQKDQDLKSIKRKQKSKLFEKLNQDIKQQLQLEQIQNQRLRKIQQSLLMKDNLRKKIQARINSNNNHQRYHLKNQQKKQIISDTQLIDDDL